MIVAAGRLVEEKDFSTLLRAFAIVCSQRSAELIVLGDGPLRGDLERLAGELGIAGNVRFEGMVGNVYAYFSRSGVFVNRTLNDSVNGYCLASNLVDRSFEFTVAHSTSQYSSLLGGLLK